MFNLTDYEWPENYGNPSWFVNDRFGLFIHFGLFSVAARHEWVMTLEQMSKEEYNKYFNNFNPDLLDAKKLAKIARECGFKYAVLTAKHHEGFALWDTKLSEYKITNTHFKRDIVREYIDAFRNEGLKIGLYFSLIDWYNSDFVVDGYHPQRNNQEYIKSNNGNMKNYVEFMHGQVRELLTNYGIIDYLWFDFSYSQRDWGTSVGKGKEDWKSEKLEKMIFELQPNIILNDRLGLDRGVGTPEQYQRNSRDEINGKKLIWEACQTLNNSWGYDRDNLNWKSSEMVIKLLIDTVSKGGNMLLNIAPNGRGEIDDKTDSILKDITNWIKLHKKSIYGCSESNYIPPQDARFTQNGNRLYLHLFSWPYRTVLINGLGGQVEYVQLLNDHSEIKYIEKEGLSGKRKSHKDLNIEITEVHIKDKFNENALLLNLPVQKPDVIVPVIEFILKDKK